MQVQQEVSLKQFNTLNVDSTAAHYVAIKALDELKHAMQWYKDPENLAVGSPLLILGSGSNIVLQDDFPGLVVHMQGLGIKTQEKDDGTVLVTAEAGENWHSLVEFCCQYGLNGIENLALIPGTVGAAPIQNIGAYGVELSDVFVSLLAFNLETRAVEVLDKRACHFSYRNSIFKDQDAPRRVVIAVTLRLQKQAPAKLAYKGLKEALVERGVDADTASAQQVAEAVIDLRQRKLPDPEELPNVGSFFKNPIVSAAHYEALLERHPDIVAYEQGDDYKLAAGWLVDQAGWKGKQKNGVGVHDKQALVLVNFSGSGADALQLAAEIKQDIFEKYDVELELEPRVY